MLRFKYQMCQFIWGFKSLSKLYISYDNFVGRGNQYIQLVKDPYCKLLTIRKQLPPFPHKVRSSNHRPQRWEATVLPLRHRDPIQICENMKGDAEQKGNTDNSVAC